ncbi:putative aldehyde dehydrogenase [Acrocarpospora pleiomorpha]|uniref:Putative aldehyde dehydrogenase n=1 Tax=Acrocarpospora pleiomorpha TaxID=90975 RepID=A0A5M3XUA5_9ACTN|nr:aldehyde dehydrogenase family protein [Acrocarpospora pleiomorpha]GES24622.1 putative aldehyde dehydrogenase [Acrocarpospora pleiomorpha]
MTDSYDPARAVEELWIDGAWRKPAGNERYDVISPSTEGVYRSTVMGTAADAEAAVAAARRSFDDGRWRSLTQAERSAVLEQARQILGEQVDQVAHVITSELGTTIPRSAEGVRDRAMNYIADGIQRVDRLIEPTTIVDPKGTSLVVREPIGVVGAIAPWNGPFSIGTGKIVPALITGCSVVFKPSPQTPFDIHYLAAALHEAGLPAGVLNIVPGDAEVGQSIVGHRDVDAVTFTGSTAVGREIGAVSGRDLKPVSLELGGKSAAIVLDDADIAQAGTSLAASFCAGSGQSCIALTRAFVPGHLRDQLVDAIVAEIEKMRVGDPFDAQTDLGPLVSKAARERVAGYVEEARGEGAVIATGGRRPADLNRGWYYEPTLLVGVDNTMRVAREEIFGPVGCVIEYDTVDDAIAMANDNDYGLHGAVYTADRDRGLEIARAVRTGTFGINGFGFTVAAPFGGYKQSGVGREHGDEGLLFTLEYKSIKL